MEIHPSICICHKHPYFLSLCISKQSANMLKSDPFHFLLPSPGTQCRLPPGLHYTSFPGGRPASFQPCPAVHSQQSAPVQTWVRHHHCSAQNPAGKSEVRVPAQLHSTDGSLPGLQIVSFSQCAHTVDRGSSNVSSLFHTGINLIMGSTP